MSFVSIIAMNKFITVMSDGQVTKTETGEVLQEDYQKFRKISPNQFIAYTGVKEFCEGLANQIPYKKSAHDLEDITNQIASVTQLPELKAHKIHFGIGGIDSNGDISFYTIQNQSEPAVNFYKPIKDDDINYAFFESGHLSAPEKMETKLIECLKITGYNTPNKCLRAQKLLNDYVADNDSTVNKKTFSITIKK